MTESEKQPRAPLSEITRSALVREIARYDRIGEAAYFTRLARLSRQAGLRPVTRGRRFFIQVGDRLYHSKAVISAACVHTSVKRPLGTVEFSGGVARLGPVLRRCGLVLWDAKENKAVTR